MARSNARAQICALLVILAAHIVTSRTLAYSYVADGAHWPGPTIPVVLQLGAASRPLQDGSTSYDQSVERAMKLWNQQIATAQFTWSEAPRTAAPSSDGVTTVSFESKIYGDDLGTSTLAITEVRSSGGRIIEADVAFNSGKIWDSHLGTLDGNTGNEIHRVALHELGHALGLDHPDAHGQKVVAIMNSHASDVDRLQQDDVSGARSLYGTPDNAPALTRNGRLANISTRGRVGTGDSVMIGGFIIKDATKRVLIRALGPSLPLTGTLTDPVLELHNRNGDVIASNNNWNDTQRQEIAATGLAPDIDRESAIVMTLPAEPFTAIVSGNNSTTGAALVEVYNLSPENGRLANISTRGFVGTGDNVLIGGFIIDGPESKKVVVRGIGPSLS
ncbi:MAG: matrixin family metalloprotease, partial [Chthoniobacterales bacterium]